MITNEEAQRNYDAARQALNRIIRSDSATEQDRQRAAKQRDELILNGLKPACWKALSCALSTIFPSTISEEAWYLVKAISCIFAD
jgi:hypothetical protein